MTIPHNVIITNISEAEWIKLVQAKYPDAIFYPTRCGCAFATNDNKTIARYFHTPSYWIA